jgi:hypothetical protein
MKDRVRPADPPPRSPGDFIVIALFALLLLAPATIALTGHAGFDTAFIESTELRRPFTAPPPTKGALATGGWQRDAEREIADAFPLRRHLIEAYDSAKYAWLRDVGSTHVIRGRDGWLFYGDEERSYITGDQRPSDADLTRLAAIYRARAEAAARHGARYIVLIVPNKSTVYENELPPGMRIVTPTPADRLSLRLRALGVPLIEMRFALTGAAAKGEVYSKGDTHWNDAGAYLGYQAIITALRDTGVPVGVRGAAIRSHVETGDGDLLRLAGIASLARNDVVRYDFERHAHAVAAPSYPTAPETSAFAAEAFENPSARGPGAVIFGDSFADALAPFVAESFRRTVLLRHVNVTDVQFAERVVAAEKPAVVIQEIVERNLIYAANFKP